ncbi:DUF4232 domain-containing protein [Amycolatopsis sp. BJA-103]|uniref:DUF4232 domain-containing protein n=1 Tax=Amycolatopsis sp. BJA-103 TaxID=1911175 RepID=UPI000C77F14F|nr:DUF4232 domain-containing protein [Amycolatopsis sp. BJA-103]AUI58587.1 DUF4232 domain-containing protein [Amycolatopsis sp. BJA-103]PNE15006.1 DUF4232 domain-containing protein [Amycolatopsis sp. BJA-103]
MNVQVKKAATAMTVGGLVAGGLLVAGGVAGAMPSDKLCGASDVEVSVTQDPSHAAGHEAYVLTYTAASPTTNCKLKGAPTALTFVADGQLIDDVAAVPDATAANAAPVNLREGRPAVSRIVQASAAAPNPRTPTTITFDLPTGPGGVPVVADWPAGEPLKGATVQVTAVTA